MKKLAFLIFCCITPFNALFAQTKEQKELLRCFNKFSEYMGTDADSSIHYARLLAKISKSSNQFENLIHNSFALTFIQLKDGKEKDITRIEGLKHSVEVGLKIMTALKSDTSKIIRDNIIPLNYWISLQQDDLDDKKLIEITNNFIRNELTGKDLYQNFTARYSLLIYQIISQKKELRSLADQLLTFTYNYLKSKQVNVQSDSASRELLIKRAWYRYLFAYSNYLKGSSAAENGNSFDATKYFQLGFDYSPDLTDKNNLPAYFYESVLFGQAEDKFQNKYISYLTRVSTDKIKTLAVLSTIALRNPLYKADLQAFYESNFPDQGSFSAFWIDQINKDLKLSADFRINLIDGRSFSSSSNKGKWIMIDFWGTWCAPCRKEHPDLQKFNEEVIVKQPEKIVLLTVACKDDKSKVVSYLKQLNYNFPVAMEDRSIVKAFGIKGYPTKVLITPQGKYLVVPFNINWIDFVKNYAAL
jgi:thiol-disulfide isomerase/thioredoxin